MKTNSTSVEAFIIAGLIAPFVYLFLIWNQLPAEIATHYDLQGNPNDWMRKETAAAVMGGLSLFMYFLLRSLPRIDPKGRLQSSNYQKLRLVITLSFAAITGWLWYMGGHQTDTQATIRVLLVIVCCMLAGIGNYLTTVRPNWFVGIRTPWTLANEAVWRKTHRMGGRLMVVGGILGAVVALVIPAPYMAGVVTGIILLSSLLPVASSYRYFRREKADQLTSHL